MSLAALAVMSLGACSASVDEGTKPSVAQSTESVVTSFAPGNYEATGIYQSPGGIQEIVVRMELDEDGTVVDVEVEPQARIGNAAEFQNKFAGGIKKQVVGIPVTELDVSRVSGSSLTSGGFNAAVDKIIEEAAQ